MRTKQFILAFSIFIFMMGIVCSCQNNNKQTAERDAILKELASLQDRLPYTVPGTRLTLTDVSIENDVVVYTCSVCNEDWEAMAIGADVSKTDRNMARIISNVSIEDVNKFIEHSIGLKYVYTSEETGEKLLEIEMSADKLKEIRDKVENGELEAYSFMEIAQMDLAKLETPSQIEDGVWLTDAYIKGHNIYYVATIEAELEPSDFTSSDKAEMKKNTHRKHKG